MRTQGSAKTRGTGRGRLLAALTAGVLAAPLYSVYPNMGDGFLIISFVVVVIGGLGSVSGAFWSALLIGLVLAHAELLAERRAGAAPILLLDEIAAHLDVSRRSALFEELLRIGSQAWMTGTDRQAFSALEGRAHFLHVEDGRIRALS